MKLSPGNKGQSAVEFLLIAPWLFLLFFAIMQTAYIAFVSLALQRAALAVAHEASLTGSRDPKDLQDQVLLSLAPLPSLHRATLMGILACECSVRTSADGRSVTARIHYPMPLWVPLAGPLFGERLSAALLSRDRSGPTPQLRRFLILLGLSLPELTGSASRLPYIHWMDFTATDFNEGRDR